MQICGFGTAISLRLKVMRIAERRWGRGVQELQEGNMFDCIGGEGMKMGSELAGGVRKQQRVTHQGAGGGRLSP